MTLAFTSSFTPLPRRVNAVSHRCTVSPRMALLSHEKLDVVIASSDAEMANYRLEIEIPGAYSKNKRRETVQSMRKNASFNGFRKGTIPPFIMKDIPGFVLKDCTSELIQAALKELDLNPVEGEASEPKLDEDKMMSEFEVGEDFVFTCEMQLQKALIDVADIDNLEDVVTVDAEVKEQLETADITDKL